jgi:hypothetical protein
LYLGAPAFSQAGPTAYDAIGSAKGIVPVVKQVKGLGLSNFGGVMYWDGAEGMLNIEGGKSIMDVSYGPLGFALDFFILSVDNTPFISETEGGDCGHLETSKILTGIIVDEISARIIEYKDYLGRHGFGSLPDLEVGYRETF